MLARSERSNEGEVSSVGVEGVIRVIGEAHVGVQGQRIVVGAQQRSVTVGAISPIIRNYDDSSWSTISTPHTFNDTDTFDDLRLE